MENSQKSYLIYRPAILVFLLVAIPALLTSYFLKENIKGDENVEFRLRAKDAIEDIENAFNEDLHISRHLKAFFISSEVVKPEEWEEYLEVVESEKHHFGVGGIAFLPEVEAKELNRFLESARKEIEPNYKITPPGDRTLYFPVYYLKKFTKTSDFIGFDHYSNPQLRKAIDEAIRTRRQTATDRLEFKFPDDTNTYTGIIVYTPIFKKRPDAKPGEQESLIGLISCQIIGEDFFSSVLKQIRKEYFYIQIWVGTSSVDENLILNNIPAEMRGYRSAFEYIDSKVFAGKVFTIKFRSTPEYEKTVSMALPNAIAIGGIFIAILLGWIVGLQIYSRKMAQELTEKLKISEKELKMANAKLENEIKEKEALIKEIEFEKHLFDELLENIPDAVYFKDINSRFLRFSRYALNKLNLKLEEVLGKTDFDLFTEEHAREAFEDEQKIIRTGKPIVGKIERETWKDGRITYALTTKMPYRDKEGKIIGTFGISKDITEIKVAQDRLKEEQERLRLTLNSIGDAVISTDEIGRVVSINPVAEKLTGWKAEEAIGRPLKEVFVIVNEQTRQPVEDPVEKVIKTGQITGLANNTMLISKDGSERIIADSAAPIKDEAGKIIGIVLVFRDVTERYQRDQERIKAARMETIERLASGLVHDFNNILTAIMGNVSLMKAMLGESNQAYSMLDSVERSCIRAKNLTRELQTFTKSGAPVKRPIEIVPLLRQAIELALYGSRIELRFVAPDDLPLVEGDDSQLSQAFTHLATFGVQTMTGGGSLFVSVEKVRIDETAMVKLDHGDYIKIIIQDHGVGIPQDKLARFFEPYYSHVGPGSGIGLAAAESIIRKHNGLVQVHSIVNKGTTFIIYLPASKKQPERPRAFAKFTPEMRGKRILIMDDEESICILVKALLERYGFNVETALNGEEAIRKFVAAQRAGMPFALVILDLTIQGGIGGKDVIVELKKHDPNVKAVVSSGYSFDPVLANYKDYGFVGVIQKPYSVDELKDLVAELLS